MCAERPTPEELKPSEKESVAKLLEGIEVLAEGGDVDTPTGNKINTWSLPDGQEIIAFRAGRVGERLSREERIRLTGQALTELGLEFSTHAPEPQGQEEPLPVAMLTMRERVGEGKEIFTEYLFFQEEGHRIEKFVSTFDYEEMQQETRRRNAMTETERLAFTEERYRRRRAAKEEEGRLGLHDVNEKEITDLNKKLEPLIREAKGM